jgi:hypothetical protein
MISLRREADPQMIAPTTARRCLAGMQCATRSYKASSKAERGEFDGW